MGVTLRSFQELGAYLKRFPSSDHQEHRAAVIGCVIVTKHAVERLLDWRRTGSLLVRDAEETLARAVQEGQVVGKRPGGAVEYCWNDLFVLVKKDRDGALVVLTVNGNRAWRHWYRKTHVSPKYGAKARAAL
ncbi:MAG: hypothetical protein C4575_13715 [Desulforudis sp.]|nr:MAG: hypothetical protein C4575_13715 [Desulforudis sp.]